MPFQTGSRPERQLRQMPEKRKITFPHSALRATGRSSFSLSLRPPCSSPSRASGCNMTRIRARTCVRRGHTRIRASCGRADGNCGFPVQRTAGIRQCRRCGMITAFASVAARHARGQRGFRKVDGVLCCEPSSDAGFTASSAKHLRIAPFPTIIFVRTPIARSGTHVRA